MKMIKIRKSDDKKSFDQAMKDLNKAGRLYRLYYLSKLSKMKVPVIWTSRSKPLWTDF